MAEHDHNEPRRSIATIKGHPIHPMLIPFPIALLTLAPVADILYAVRENIFWAQASYYLIWAGLGSGVLAALVGLVDFVGIRRARRHRQGWIHLVANVGVLALATVNGLIRVDAITSAIMLSGLILSLVALGLLIVGGWYGGELAYRQQIGVIGDAEERSRSRVPSRSRENLSQQLGR